MKLFKFLILWFIVAVMNISVFAASWGDSSSDPVTILDGVKWSAGTTDTKLDISGWTGKWVYGTLSYITDNIYPYLDWGVFIWLSLAVILIIYNASLLVLAPVHEWQAATVKKRIMFIAMGIIVITGFYFIVKMVLSIVKNISW